MYSNEIKELYRLQAAREAARAGMWSSIFFGAVSLFGYVLGWYEGGLLENNPLGAFAAGYLFGAFFGWVGTFGAYEDESFDVRERHLQVLHNQWKNRSVALELEKERLRRMACRWNAFCWPFVLVARFIMFTHLFIIRN